MTATLTTLASLSINATRTGDAINTLGTAITTTSKTYGTTFADGTGAGKANLIWWAERTLLASANEDLDLAGVLVDPFGQALTFTTIKALAVSAKATNVNNVVLGGAAANALAGLFGATTHKAIVRPGATLVWIAGAADATGYAVVADTGDQLRVANSGAGTSVVYDIVILGEGTAA